MAKVETREDFTNYCLRALGAPMIKINVEETQIEDRVDEAIAYFNEFHHAGHEETFISNFINSSELNFVANDNILNFKEGEKVKGKTSGATAVVTKDTRDHTNSKLYVSQTTGTFSSGEDVVGEKTETEGELLAEDFYVQGAVDRKYLEVDDGIYGITDILPFGYSRGNIKNVFEHSFYLRMFDMISFTVPSLTSYKLAMKNLKLFNKELNGERAYRFRRHTNKLYLDVDWEKDITPGSFVVYRCNQAIDPEENSSVWNERWLQNFAIAVIKRQWGANLKKFTGGAFAGGMSIDGNALYQEAEEEIHKLKEEVASYELPIMPIIV